MAGETIEHVIDQNLFIITNKVKWPIAAANRQSFSTERIPAEGRVLNEDGRWKIVDLR